MASDYEAICEENRRRYGTDIARIGPMLLADRYDDRTHFLFELLQNAEDALAKRGVWNGSRRVRITLSPGVLTLSHFGRPFDEADVRGVCGIAQSTKDLRAIGRFGIGFKSVYTFTDRPEIHSGDEDFAIEHYVLPKRAARVERAEDETLIVLPLRPCDTTASDEIAAGLRRLGPDALLFLHHIDGIEWSVAGGASGTYLRSRPEVLGENVRRLVVIGQETGKEEVDESWLVFHRNVTDPSGEPVGKVELAFRLEADEDRPDRSRIVPVARSPLVVFFPTVVETHLGFLVQGPYKTTPSRDNIHRDDPWNMELVWQTAELLVQAMRWLRDNKMLDVSALRCLPLEREKFPEGSLFEPLFRATRQALRDEPLLPRFDGGYVSAARAKLARTQELRDLFDTRQLARLFAVDDAAWLSGDITQDRAPAIRHYLMRELGVDEATPETIVGRLDRSFLEAQSDDWIARLYTFLNGQPALRRRLEKVPLIRLRDGRHVTAFVGGMAQAYLPSGAETGFPTVRETVCAAPEARKFLTDLGLTEPDPVDDVIANVLEAYRADAVDLDADRYARDIERIVAAFRTDSRARREKLLAALREVAFVMVVDAGDGTRRLEKPGNVYLATDRLKQLFSGVAGVAIVDDRYPCLRGEAVRELLEACDTSRSLRPVPAPPPVSFWSERFRQLRVRAGQPQTSGIKDRVEDWDLRGLAGFLALLPKLGPEQRAERARLLWESLGELAERRGRGIFDLEYTWSYYGTHRVRDDANFVRLLNDAAWVPGADGTLYAPRLVLFESLGWEPDPFVLTKIHFKPPVIDQLAREAGIEPGAIDLLRKLGITSEAELKARLGIPEPSNIEPEPAGEKEQDEPLAGEDAHGTGGAGDAAGTSDDRAGSRAGGDDARGGITGSSMGGEDGGADATKGGAAGGDGGDRPEPGKTTPGAGHDGAFVSYVAVHLEEERADPDGLDRAARMAIEESAIERILAVEPGLQRTSETNPGFDLFATDARGEPNRWVEVKAMTGSLADHPVGLSRTQFEFAREKGPAYWLYVVEHAGEPERTCILRIQDPAGRARTFTFDRGWREIARTEPPPR